MRSIGSIRMLITWRRKRVTSQNRLRLRRDRISSLPLLLTKSKDKMRISNLMLLPFRPTWTWASSNQSRCQAWWSLLFNSHYRSKNQVSRASPNLMFQERPSLSSPRPATAPWPRATLTSSRNWAQIEATSTTLGPTNPGTQGRQTRTHFWEISKRTILRLIHKAKIAS